MKTDEIKNDVTERVKTFEDAMNETGRPNVSEFSDTLGLPVSFIASSKVFTLSVTSFLISSVFILLDFMPFGGYN